MPDFVDDVSASLRDCVDAVNRGDWERAQQRLRSTLRTLEALRQSRQRDLERLSKFEIEGLDSLAFALHHRNERETACVQTSVMTEWESVKGLL